MKGLKSRDGEFGKIKSRDREWNDKRAKMENRIETLQNETARIEIETPRMSIIK